MNTGFQQSAFGCQQNAKKLEDRKAMAMHQDQEFLDYLVRALVDNPDAVKTDRKVDEMGVLITLKVDPADMGKIIGRNGATAKAIRSLLRVVGIKNNARVNLKIEEPEGGRGPRMMRDEGSDMREPRMRDVDEVVDDLKL
ncbi:MAG: KH domain-containing protein [Patescibacteria group bacterium]